MLTCEGILSGLVEILRSSDEVYVHWEAGASAFNRFDQRTVIDWIERVYHPE